MSKIAERIRKNREFKVPAGRWNFVARRPTDVEGGPMIAEVFKEGASTELSITKDLAFRIARDYVIGWDLIEDDVQGGGGQDKVPFDREDWEEWIADQSDLWGAIAIPIIRSYLDRVLKTDETAKNSQPG